MKYNPEEFDEILNIFKVESEEIIEGLNDEFLALEKHPEDKTPLKRLFQLAHSLKGSARMLGFNSIQDISHKLEDILSYWKQDEVSINTGCFEVIYDVCDFLTELVNNAVKNQADTHTGQVVIFLNKLDEFLNKNNMTSKQNENNSDAQFISSKSIDINAILLELMFVLEKDNTEIDPEDSIQAINDNLSGLFEIFEKTNFMEIRSEIAQLLTEIENRTEFKNSDLTVLKNKIQTLRTEIYNLYKTLDIKPAGKKETPKEKEKPAESPEISSALDSINTKFDNLLTNLAKIKSDISALNDAYNAIEEIIDITDNNNIRLILSKTSNILKIFINKNKNIDNDCYMVILQSLYLAKRLNLQEQPENLNNINFLLQRLSVVEDMFSDSFNTDVVAMQEKENIQHKEEYENFKMNIKPPEIQEIKTLRVDSSKLDNLIAQTGELLINGIKTREHITELSKINEKLIKWSGVSKKIVNYLKYLEKKGFFSNETNDSFSAFYKKTQNFFLSNASVINEINNDFSNLYNIIFEDDNKLHQTVMEMESIAKGIRVLPLATIFHSFPRMIRDIAKENNKQVNFIISGSDTTVDKKIIEEIKMPLVHILRNSVSHGIETPENRIKNGKSETGTIKLTAKQAENNVVLTIEDDGYGINLQKIKDTALRKGLLSEEEANMASDEQLMKLIFIPGFSTEESITEISGRGIGLDVVKTKITNLNGDIIIDSVLNKGCTVTIKLPLSMSTLKTFVLYSGGQKYAIPVSSVKYVKQISKDEVYTKNGRQCILFEEHSIPVYFLSEILGLEADFNSYDSKMTIIILEIQNKQAAYIVEKLIGDQEVFQKKLVPPIIKIKNISGFTTLSTGEICLILNPFEILRNSDRYLTAASLTVISRNTKEKHPINDKKIVIFDPNNILSLNENAELTNKVIFNGINSVFDYIQKNHTDILICAYDDCMKESMGLIRYIKSDENLNNIKTVFISNISEYDLKRQLNDLSVNLIIKQSEYSPKTITECLQNMFN